MTAQRWLQIHLVALCLLGSLFVALNTQNYLVPVGVLFAGITSVLFTDVWKWFVLHRMPGNLAAVAAVVFSLRDFLVSDSEGQLLAIANLLVYLQVILFYQEKNTRLYWQMILLSLLQVVVGTALHLGLAFGVLLLAYTVVSLSTLVLFFIHRETEQHAATLESSPPAPGISRGRILLGAPAVVRVGGKREEIRQSFLAPALARQIVVLTLGALLFAIFFFYTAPRHSGASWSGARGFTHAETGFTREVELQQMGQLLQSNEPVMRVRLYDALGRPLRRLEPYFAGEVLVRYDNDDLHARWLSLSKAGSYTHRDGPELLVAPANATIEVVDLEATGHPSLFAVAPVFKVQQPPTGIQKTADDVRFDPASHLPFRAITDDGLVPQKYQYTVATTGIRDGRHLPIVPDPRSIDETSRRRGVRGKMSLEYEKLECQSMGVDGDVRFRGLIARAEEVLKKRTIEGPRDPILVGRALEDHFLSPGNYTYSLNLNVKRDRNLDPIEDFVVNHRTGHCQYFASALVMMLRSQGIPARMVVGYRGSDYNELGAFYQVRQRNAHAWVEMYLAQHEVPEHEAVGGEVRASGAWMRLDPTPADESSNLAGTWFGTARDWLDYVDIMWSDYVVGLNQQRQQLAMYGALGGEERPSDSWLAPDRWQEHLRTVAGWLGIHIGRGDKSWRIAFDWRASLTAAVLCVLWVMLWRLGKWTLGRIDWSQLALWRRGAGRRSTVAFYARLEDLLARRGRSRRPAETPREYVDHAVRELAIRQGDALQRLVDAFYRVRFGGATLDSQEAHAIELALSELERSPVVEA